MSKGRKKKTEIILNSNNSYINFSELSVNEETLIWEYKDIRNDMNIIEKIPLSKKAATKYWKELLLERGAVAKAMLTKIERNVERKEKYLYDNYKKDKLLIDEMLKSVSELCIIKNIPRISALAYITAISDILRFLNVKINNKIVSFKDLNRNYQLEFRKELSIKNSKFFKTPAQKSFVRNVLKHSLNNFGSGENIIAHRILLNKQHTSKKSKMDLSQEIAVQLLAAATLEINEIMKKRDILENQWRISYKNKAFDSPENLENAYINYPKTLHNKKTINAENTSILNYRASYDRLCFFLHGFKLSDLSEDALKNLASEGENINNIHDPRIMSWFLDDVLVNYPLKCGKTVSTTTPMSKYSKWMYESGVKIFLSKTGREEDSKMIFKIFNDVLSIKYPSMEQLFPFMLFWLLQTGSNIEALLNMEWKEKVNGKYVEIGEFSPLGDIPVIKSFKNRGTKNWYWFPLNPNEKNGLYDIFLFLKKYLKPLWDYQTNYHKQDSTNPFWLCIVDNQSHGNIVKIITRNALSAYMKKFLQKHNIISSNGKKVTNIQLSRLRNTFITTADLGGASLEEIKEWIRHDTFDARFMYYGNSSDQRGRNFMAIHAIQEAIIDTAKNFQGKILYHTNSKLGIKKQLTFSFLAGCSDNKHPNFTGARSISEKEVCVDWDNCLSCTHSRVYKEHLPRICYRIIQYEKFQNTMSADEWENNYGTKYMIAHDVLKKWIQNGGTEYEIDLAWKEARSGEIKLPEIFPQGSIKINSDDKNRLVG